MASFRNGIKILGEFSIKQGLGRIRSFSEDRKPGRWLPEDQWAVRQPGSTCPDLCKPKKPPKPSKSWLSICKDPEPPIPCDIRHSNCPPPPPPKEGPWYSLDNLIPKKKSEKPPPLYSCREEKNRREKEEEVCERQITELRIPPDNEDICCMPKPPPNPAPVITMSCPPPKELDIMLWCGRPSTERSRIASQCQSDRLPYEEFRPQKSCKPLPFSFPCKSDTIPAPAYNKGAVAFSEFKQVEVPKPLYTRYKSVELCNEDFLLCMAEVKCPDDKELNCLSTTTSASCYPPTSCPSCPSATPPCRRPCLPSCCRIRPEPEQEEPVQASCERRVIEAASCKPVKINKATKYTFTPKPTKLIERRILKNPFASCKNLNPESRPEDEESDAKRWTKDDEPPKVITGTLTKEPQVYEREFCANNPPSWMYVLCKPGCKETPLIPKYDRLPDEPDWSSETDGLKFYDDENGNITPKPPEDPCKSTTMKPQPVVCEPQIEKEKPALKAKNRLVLMPESYNIKYSRPEDPCAVNNECESTSFDQFIQAKTSSSKKCSKSNPQMKENILYDLQRLCPNAPVDPTKLNLPCRKPVEDPCAPRFFRCYSTFSSKPRNFTSIQLVQARAECGDSSGKCKVRNTNPKPLPCPDEKPKPTCATVALPCCRKAVVPPNCQNRKPPPLCKKKLPPKPSFSECAKDPPPCPKLTECNAWERRAHEDSKRKYSVWAVMRNGFTSEEILEQFDRTGYVRSLESQAREVYANTVKCRTIKSKRDALRTQKDRIVLGLNDDPACDCEQRHIVVMQKENSNPIVPKEDEFFLGESDVPMIESTMPDLSLKNEEFQGPEDIEENGNFPAPSDNSEKDKEISKDLMGSIGSWINELFNAPTKRPVTAPRMVKPKLKPEAENRKLDTEYLKSFNDFKEQMKIKLKTETTVRLSPGDKSVEFSFDKLTEKKIKKSNRPTPVECRGKSADEIKKEAEMIPENPNPTICRFPIKINDKENIYVTLRPEEGTDNQESIIVNKSFLKKERSKNGKLEEYFFVSPPELSKSLLLNVNDHEKCSHLYNAQIKEPQPHQLRRTHSFQRNARCYTTDANLVENSRGNSFMSDNKKTKRSVFFASDLPTSPESLASKKKTASKKRIVSGTAGVESVFDKFRSTRSLGISFAESSKPNETKTSSDELVRHLVKKTKVSARPQSFKKKPKTLISDGSAKSRFLQSATTSLVVSGLAKKENVLMPLKAGSRLMPEIKVLKLDRGPKEWPTKNLDRRLEINKLTSPSFNKSSYLSDISSKLDIEMASANVRSYRRMYENVNSSLGRDVREKNGKNKKGEDIKCILSKIDGRYDTLRAQQKLKKTEENNEDFEAQNAQNARFQKQHELFKKIPKSDQQIECYEANEKLDGKVEEKPDSSTTISSRSEVMVLDKEVEPNSKTPEESGKYELTIIEKTSLPALPLLSSNCESSKSEILDKTCTNEKPFSYKSEKNEVSNFKNKLVKTKSLQYLKEDDMRALLCSKTDIPVQESRKQTSKGYERQLSADEFPPQKSLEPVLLNRSHSAAVLAKNQKSAKLIPLGHSKNVLALSDEKKDSDKKTGKDKKNEKKEKHQSARELSENCGFTPIKKPGPNCEKPDGTSNN